MALVGVGDLISSVEMLVGVGDLINCTRFMYVCRFCNSWRFQDNPHPLLIQVLPPPPFTTSGRYWFIDRVHQRFPLFQCLMGA